MCMCLYAYTQYIIRINEYVCTYAESHIQINKHVSMTNSYLSAVAGKDLSKSGLNKGTILSKPYSNTDETVSV